MRSEWHNLNTNPEPELLRETTGHRWYRLVWCNAVITIVQSRAGLQVQEVK